MSSFKLLLLTQYLCYIPIIDVNQLEMFHRFLKLNHGTLKSVFYRHPVLSSYTNWFYITAHYYTIASFKKCFLIKKIALNAKEKKYFLQYFAPFILVDELSNRLI